MITLVPLFQKQASRELGSVVKIFRRGHHIRCRRLPLAIVVIGGLMSSTRLTLLLLPILYRRFGDPGTPRAVPVAANPENAS